MNKRESRDTPTPGKTSAPPRRADALDALRGFAILTMALSGLIPFGVLPAWMYHAQVPPPDHVFDAALAPPGLTWVDLVFPFFLFSMGASMPLALTRRIEKGESWWELAAYVAKRGFLLGAFAIYDQHIRPGGLAGHPGTSTWLLGLLGFGLLFPILARLPRSWRPTARWAIRAAGWAGAIALMLCLRYPEDSRFGTEFSKERSDIIILVLANVAAFGSIAWLVSRRNLLLRLGFLGVLIAIRLSHDSVGWVKHLWDYSPAPWIYTLYYLQYLFIVIPGTIVGDLLLTWMKTPADVVGTGGGWPRWRLSAIATLAAGLVVLLLAGLQARWLPWTPIVAFVLCAVGWRLLAHPATACETLLNRLFAWGTYWLVLGLVFEPFEGGIKKDHPTMSYYFVTTGLAIFALIALAALIDGLTGRRWIRLLIDNGQNPMIAYAGITNLLPPVLGLIGLESLVQGLMREWSLSPWWGVVWACAKTLMLALAVSLCTRRGVFWRT
ncbi:MAG: DUF5009 domain-containing protein [Phycisphaerales bacterium]|nr:MAG: DUF5009 domain-containing protein [Phycisphaerales bacterium]